jgi:hypothetical protein
MNNQRSRPLAMMVAVALLATSLQALGAPPATTSPGYLDLNRSFEERAADLV